MPLKILHFAPDMTSRNSLRDTIDQILNSLGHLSEVHLATLSAVPAKLPNHYAFHCIGNGKENYGQYGIVNLLALQKRFLVLLYDLMPDVVHIHGSYSYISSRIELWSRKRGFPVVFSPYGGMNPSFIDAQYGMRTWKMILYQKNMTFRASAMQISDKGEYDYLRHEGLSRRVVYIEPPTASNVPIADDDDVFVSGEASPEESTSIGGSTMTKENLTLDYEDYSTHLLRLYKKVLETRQLHLDVNSSEAVSALLHLSLSDDPERHPLCAEDILNLRSLSPSQWHAIQLYGNEHDIMSLLFSSAIRLQLSQNFEEDFWSDVFPPLIPKEKGHLPSDRLLTENRRRTRMIGSITLGKEYSIRKVCHLLENIKYHLSLHDITLRHLCDLYEVFRFDDMDEPRLEEVLKRLHLYKFCRRLCQVLSEVAYLEEGFMPVPSLNDGGTEKIRQILVTY